MSFAKRMETQPSRKGVQIPNYSQWSSAISRVQRVAGAWQTRKIKRQLGNSFIKHKQKFSPGSFISNLCFSSMPSWILVMTLGQQHQLNTRSVKKFFVVAFCALVRGVWNQHCLDGETLDVQLQTHFSWPEQACSCAQQMPMCCLFVQGVSNLVIYFKTRVSYIL